MMTRRVVSGVRYAEIVKRSVAVCASVAILFFVVEASGADDVVRYLVKTETGAFEERSAEGTITEVSPDGVSLDAKGKNAPETNPIPAKTAMRLMGYAAGPLRLPLSEMEPENRKKLDAALKAHNLI